MERTTTGVEFERHVADTLKGLNYSVITEPPTPGGCTWQERISSWLTEPSSRPDGPDMVVANGEKIVLVEAKAYPILLGPVIQAGHYSDYFKAPILICVPDEAFPQIPDSIREWAEDNGIAVSSLRDIGDRLKVLLEGE